MLRLVATESRFSSGNSVIEYDAMSKIPKKHPWSSLLDKLLARGAASKLSAPWDHWLPVMWLGSTTSRGSQGLWVLAAGFLTHMVTHMCKTAWHCEACLSALSWQQCSFPYLPSKKGDSWVDEIPPVNTDQGLSFCGMVGDRRTLSSLANSRPRKFSFSPLMSVP